MSAAQPLRRVAIIGDGLRAAFPAAYLATRFVGGPCEVVVIPYAAVAERGDVIVRPDIARAHGVLGIFEERLMADTGAKRVFATDLYDGTDNIVSLPFGDYGMPWHGVEFQHYWCRASLDRELPDISRFNAALCLHRVDAASVPAGYGLPHTDYGYRVAREAYVRILKRIAESAGASFLPSRFLKLAYEPNKGSVVSVNTEAGVLPVDFVFLSTIEKETAKLSQNHAEMCARNLSFLRHKTKIPGLELFCLQRAMEHFIALLPDARIQSVEIGEFNRLVRSENERIDDMEALLFQSDEAVAQRPALARKVQVFRERGRVPTEDYEVFSIAEWMTALLHKGYFPRSYDRLTDRLQSEELSAMLTTLSGRIENAVNSIGGDGD